MRHISLSRCSVLIGSLLSAVMMPLIGEAIAQSLDSCAPPNANEYLLLVVNETQQTEAQLQQALPRNAVTNVCQYIDRAVVRVSGFASAEVANAWAQYLSGREGLQTFVVSPAADTASAIGGESSGAPSLSSSSPAASPTPSPSTVRTAYNPRSLGAGYAVLVDYANRPEVATEVQQVLNREIGLVTYDRQPYLLGVHTDDPTVAASILQTLSDRGFAASIVDSRRAVLLFPAVVTAIDSEQN